MNLTRRQFNKALAVAPLVPSVLCAKDKPVREIKPSHQYLSLDQHEIKCFDLDGNRWGLACTGEYLVCITWSRSKESNPEIHIYLPDGGVRWYEVNGETKQFKLLPPARNGDGSLVPNLNADWFPPDVRLLGPEFELFSIRT